MPFIPQRRSQAAMEFLLTYGWAILVILVIIGALAYFGVLSPAKLLPDKCEFTAGVECKDYVVYSDGYLFGGEFLDVNTPDGEQISSLSLDVINGLGESVYVNRLKVAGDEGFDCMEVRLDECPEETSFRLEGGELSYNPLAKCFSINQFYEDICGDGNDNEFCSQNTPESLMHWEAGKSFKQNVKIAKSNFFSIPCVGTPPEGEKVKATITLEYYKDDPSFTHTVTGDLYLTVESMK
ncbi:MAG: hypothetical protein R6U32_07600 [Candidatus Woesearchaeota archaeon]